MSFSDRRGIRGSRASKPLELVGQGGSETSPTEAEPASVNPQEQAAQEEIERLRRQLASAQQAAKRNSEEPLEPQFFYGTSARKHVRKRDGVDVVNIKLTVPRDLRSKMAALAAAEPETYANASDAWTVAATQFLKNSRKK